MKDHLPECPANWGVGDMPEGPCLICQMLRACEQRVLAEREADGPWFRSVVHDCCVDKQTAYAAGLYAARKAVGDLPHPMIDVECECGACAALAAIDALREVEK